MPLFNRLAGGVRRPDIAAHFVVQFYRRRFIKPERDAAISNSHAEDSQPDNHANPDASAAYFRFQPSNFYSAAQFKLHYVQQ